MAAAGVDLSGSAGSISKLINVAFCVEDDSVIVNDDGCKLVVVVNLELATVAARYGNEGEVTRAALDDETFLIEKLFMLGVF